MAMSPEKGICLQAFLEQWYLPLKKLCVLVLLLYHPLKCVQIRGNFTNHCNFIHLGSTIYYCFLIVFFILVMIYPIKTNYVEL